MDVSKDKYLPTAVIALSFLAGAGVMVLEICASRMLSPYFGNSIFVWGSLIGIVLLALSLGYLLGGVFADKLPSEKILFSVVSLSGLLVFLVPILSGAVFSFSRRFGFVFGPLVSGAIVFLPPAVLLGAVSPYSLKLIGSGKKKAGALGKLSGILYAVSTAGSLAGTFLATFFLAPFFGTRETVLGLGIVLFFSGVASFLLLSGRKKTALLVLPLAILPMIFFGGAPSFGDDFTPSNVQVIHSEESLYQRIVIADGPSWRDPSRRMRLLLMDGMFSGAVYPDEPEETPFPYIKYFGLSYAVNQKIESALFVGGGSFSLPRKFLDSDPSIKIDVVEIDPAVVRVSREYLNLSESPGFGIFIGDGRTFLESRPEGKYDLVGVDAYSGWTVPAHMVTEEFFRLAHSRLSEDGLFVGNFIGATGGNLSRASKMTYRTLSKVFPTVYVFPVNGPLEENALSNLIFIASKSQERIPKEVLESRARELSVKLGLPGLEGYLKGYDPSWGLDGGEENGILTDNYSPINNLRDPELSPFFILG